MIVSSGHPRLDPDNGADPVDGLIEGSDSANARALRAGHEIGLGEIEMIELVYLDSAKEHGRVDRGDRSQTEQ